MGEFMSTSPSAKFKARSIELPKLRFHNNNTGTRPITGLIEYGPFDLENRAFDKLSLIVVHDGTKAELINRLTQHLKKSAEDLLKINLEISKEIIIDSTDVLGYIEKIEDELNEHQDKGSILLQVLRGRTNTSATSPYYLLRIKMLNREKPLSVQSILIPTIRNLTPPIINQLILSIYAKCGGIPWILAEKITAYLRKCIFIGFGSFVSPKNADFESFQKVGFAVGYDNGGKMLFSDSFKVIDEEEKMSEEDLAIFTRRIIRKIRNISHDNEGIVVHKLGDIQNDEMNIITEILKNSGFSFAFLGFPRDSLALVDLVRNTYADAGWYFHAGQQSTSDDTFLNTFYLQGFASPFKGGRKVNLIKYRIAYLWKAFLKPNIVNIYDDIARQILYLSRINFGTAVGKTKEPVTIHYTKRALNLIKAGLSPEKLTTNVLHMI